MSDGKSEAKGFLVYYDSEIIICRLADEEAGALFKSLFPYGKERIKPDFENNAALAMAFDILSMAIDRDKEKYIARCKKNRENISKRWNKNNTDENERIPSYTKDTNTNNNNNININNNTNKDKKNICPEPDKLTPDPSGILMPLVDKTDYDVPLSKIAQWEKTFPAVDVKQELLKMVSWLNENPARRKTRRGIGRFIHNWLSKEQDRGGVYRNGSRQQDTEEEQRRKKQEEETLKFYDELYSKYPAREPTPDDPFQ